MLDTCTETHTGDSVAPVLTAVPPRRIDPTDPTGEAIPRDSLLGRLQHRDEGAMECAVDRHAHALFVLIDRIVKDRWAAEDLVQDVFLRLFTHSHSLKSADGLGSWLRRVARNRALTHVRDRRPAVGMGLPIADDRPSPDEVFERRESLGEVLSAVDRLNEPLRTTFKICAIDGADYATAAEILGSNKTTINTRMFRSWQRLRTTFGSDELRSRSA